MFFIFTLVLISLNANLILAFDSFIYLVIFIAIIQEFVFFFLIRNISKRFVSDRLSKAFAFSVAIKNTALTAGIAIQFSSDIALVSSMVILIHIPMFSYILWKKENI